MEHGLSDLGTDPMESNFGSTLEQEQKSLHVPGQILESAEQWDSEAGYGMDPPPPHSIVLEQSWEQGYIIFFLYMLVKYGLMNKWNHLARKKKNFSLSLQEIIL